MKVKVTLKSASPAIAPFDAKQAQKVSGALGPQLGVPVEITNSIGMKLVLIPPGEFLMGSPKELIEEELKTPGIGTDDWYKTSAGRGTTAPSTDHEAVLLGDVLGDAGRVPAGHGQEPQRVLGHGQGAKPRLPDRTRSGFRWRMCRGTMRWSSAGSYRIYRRRKQRGECIVCHRRRSGSMRAAPGARVATVSVPAAAAIPGKYDEHGLSDYGWFGSNSGGMTHAVGVKRANALGLV